MNFLHQALAYIFTEHKMGGIAAVISFGAVIATTAALLVCVSIATVFLGAVMKAMKGTADAARVRELSGLPVQLGRYCHMADSFHIYGANLAEFQARFLGAIEKRTFQQRTMRYEDVREIMESARPVILEKARRMGRGRNDE